jgi:hypothetical protein
VKAIAVLQSVQMALAVSRPLLAVLLRRQVGAARLNALLNRIDGLVVSVSDLIEELARK